MVILVLLTLSDTASSISPITTAQLSAFLSKSSATGSCICIASMTFKLTVIEDTKCASNYIQMQLCLFTNR